MEHGTIELRFSRPSGAAFRKPSQTMADALQRLTDSDEMQSLVSEAQSQGRKVVVQVFHSSAGHPILIHLTVTAQDAA